MGWHIAFRNWFCGASGNSAVGAPVFAPSSNGPMVQGAKSYFVTRGLEKNGNNAIILPLPLYHDHGETWP